jgi:ABC-type branched-subunit amino acid transport system ATPase component
MFSITVISGKSWMSWNVRGYTFVVIEHNMEVVMSLCRRIVVLSQGERIAEGTPAEIADNPLVLDAYFGR